ncbi:MAG: DedA family protein [Haloarculaceae archaeon]
MASFALPADSRLRRFIADYGLLVVAGVFFLLGVVGIALFLVGEGQFARSLLSEYGIPALLLTFVLEGAMLLYFAPSESLVPISLATIAHGAGGYDPGTVVAIFAVAVLGATIGQTALFVLAKRGGREWLLAKPWFRIGDDRLARFDRWFERWGPIAVPVSNALPLTRGMLTVPAGLAEMSTRRFAVLSAVGTLAFELWLAGGWVFVQRTFL